MAASVAVPVVRTVAIAGVRSGPPGELVCFHDVHLWAELSGDVVGITVVVAVSVVWLAILTDGWERDCVEGSNAAAVGLAEVDVVLNRAIEELWLEEPIWIEAWALREGGSCVVWAVDGVASGAALRGQVKGLVLSIDIDSEGVEAIDSLVTKVGVSELLLGLGQANSGES